MCSTITPRRNRRYTIADREDAIDLIEDKGLSANAVAALMHIPSPAQVYRWHREYCQAGEEIEQQLALH